jgi:hypothetical protein
MTFEELLDQAIALLQRRGRLTYRALKRQFNLDDDYLEDLKAELIQGQRLAVDEDGAVLVWTGGTAVSLRTTSPAPQVGAPPGPRRALHRHRDVSRHGYDLLAPRSGSGADGGRTTMMDLTFRTPRGDNSRIFPEAF